MKPKARVGADLAQLVLKVTLIGGQGRTFLLNTLQLDHSLARLMKAIVNPYICKYVADRQKYARYLNLGNCRPDDLSGVRVQGPRRSQQGDACPPQPSAGQVQKPEPLPLQEAPLAISLIWQVCCCSSLNAHPRECKIAHLLFSCDLPLSI